jgi:dihydrofolate reductase
MGRLIYSTIASLDGYVEDRDGNIDWGAPDDELSAFVSDLERSIGTCLYGRRMYETMVYWETAHLVPGQDAVGMEYAAIWQSSDKIVYSRTLESTRSARTRIKREFDAEEVWRMKEGFDRDMTIGGAGLAAAAIRSSLVDELAVFVVPAVIGGGKCWLPSDVRVNLELLETRRFAGGSVYLRYRPTS